MRAVRSVKPRIALHARSASGEQLYRVRVRRRLRQDVDRELRRWYDIVGGLRPDTMTLTMASVRVRLGGSRAFMDLRHPRDLYGGGQRSTTWL